jgi:hypothetical protein
MPVQVICRGGTAERQTAEQPATNGLLPPRSVGELSLPVSPPLDGRDGQCIANGCFRTSFKD